MRSKKIINSLDSINNNRTSYRVWVVLFLAFSLLSVSCSSKKMGPPPITMVSVATSVIRSEPLSIKVVGTVEPMETVTVKPQVSGVITQVNFIEGQEVKEGQLLFRIDPLPFQIALDSAKAQLAKDMALAANAENQAKRYADLVKKDYVTKDQYETSRTQADMYKAMVRIDEATVSQAKLNLDYSSVKATIPGRTGARLVHQGLLVKANETPLVVINKMRPILVNFSIPGTQFPHVQKYAAGGKLEVRAYPSRENSDAVVKGELYFSDNAVDPNTGTITLKAKFSNEEGALWPGQFVDTELILAIENNALTVPAAAVVAGQEGTFVFVVGEGNKVEKRPVKVNRTVNDTAVIDEGLQPGQTVVTDGQMRLVPGAQVDIKTNLPAKKTPGKKENGSKS